MYSDVDAIAAGFVQGPHAAVLAAVEVAAAAVVRYKYLCEGACFGEALLLALLHTEPLHLCILQELP
jgi:hypothetical protein